MKIAAKNDKNGPKLIKIPQKLRCFLYIFRIYSLKIFAGGGLGGATANSTPCLRPWRDAIVFKAKLMCCQWWWLVNVGRFERWITCWLWYQQHWLDEMFEDICYIMHVILCNDMIEVRGNIWLSLYCKFHGECDIEIILKIGQLTGRVVCETWGLLFWPTLWLYEHTVLYDGGLT